MAATIQSIVAKQTQKVLQQGARLGKFDQIRQRYFWSTYLFIADTSTNKIAAGGYDIFKTIPGASGQGYPTNVNLTLRETNWLNAGRVPDNQNFAISEIGVTIRTPPIENDTLANQPSTGIFQNLTSAQKTYITATTGKNYGRALSALDAYNIAFGTVLEISFLTNSVPLGLIGDFSQSGGIITPAGSRSNDKNSNAGLTAATNGMPTAAFRRKFKVPILLSSGENMGMRLTVPRDITLTAPNYDGSSQNSNGIGWYEIRVDWWAIESFVEKS